ncbi:cupin domain-containing protein [Actinomadura gamaensis]|uniref:Cupin domain-containing protein n=1 Tax=Actinomadura gamaensis TaxID=1763541 RepID=A0ABV9TWC7_9ACTN
MTDGLILAPGAGRAVRNSGMTLKIGEGTSTTWSIFEAVVPAGFDVGAHLHHQAEEFFYILEGELDLLAFQPHTPSPDWLTWTSADGARVTRGGPGSCMHVPARCPHAFHNPGPAPVRMLFQVSPPGHEHYLDELADLLTTSPSPETIAELRTRHDIHQLTPLIPDRRQSRPPVQ